MWLAGGGTRGGMTYGNTDEVGHRATENIVTPSDYQATLLRLFGLDYQQLAFLHNGQQQKLVSGDARVVKEIMA